MSDRYLYQCHIGTVGDLKNLGTHYGIMAGRGWMLDKIGAIFNRYRRIKPCAKRFYVDLLPQITAFDYPENENAQAYRRLCEESGWTFVAASRQFHVFCAEGETPVPIHTDERIEAQIYLRVCRRYELFPLLLPLLVIGFLVIPQLRRSGIELFLSNLLIFQILGYAFFLAGYAWVLGFVCLWYLRTAKAAKHGLPLPTVSYRLSRVRMRVLALGMAAFVICLTAGVVLELKGGLSGTVGLVMGLPIIALGVGLWLRRQIDTRRRERKANILLTVIVIVLAELIAFGAAGVVISRAFSGGLYSQTLDGRPTITLRDIGVETAAAHTSTTIRGSVAVPVHYSHWEINTDGSVHSEVYHTRSRALARALYTRYAGELARRSHGIGATSNTAVLSAEDAAFWGADEGIAVYGTGDATDLVLLHERGVLRLSLQADGLDTDTAVGAVRALWR